MMRSKGRKMYEMQKDSLVDVDEGKRKRLEESGLLMLCAVKHVKAAIKACEGCCH